MSQAKVDARKEYKKNRKKILAKQKRMNALGRLLAGLFIIAVVVGIGWSIYSTVHPKPPYDISSFNRLVQTDEYGILSPVLDE